MEAAASVLPSAAISPGFVGRIPVRNLWLLMLYASDLFRSRGVASISVEEITDDVPDLVAEILAHIVERRLRTPLTSGYQPHEAILSRVRGRIDVLTTERHQLISRGLVACDFEKLTADTPRNRFVRAALESISSLVERPELAHRCRVLAKGMHVAGVGPTPPSRRQMATERYGRHDAHDKAMVSAAQLAFDLSLPLEASGRHDLLTPDREENWVRRLFERGVGGLYEIALSPEGWDVSRGASLDWPIEAATPKIERILPSMRTDIVVENARTGQCVVVDTKFTTILTSGWYREESLRSGYLYQMYAYLRSQVGRGDPVRDKASGLLLHPSVGCEVDETAVIQGHAIRFGTVDLTAAPRKIRDRLLELVRGPGNPQVRSSEQGCGGFSGEIGDRL